jgi:hypothetical protein
MLAYRRTWYIKQGCMQDAVKMIQQGVDIARERGKTGRAYWSNVGPADVVVWEEDWPSAQEHDQWWVGFSRCAECQEWVQQWLKLVERGGAHEIWDLKA